LIQRVSPELVPPVPDVLVPLPAPVVALLPAVGEEAVFVSERELA